ncbi:hypothetical protein DPMN_191612 [Dreissena polymorpha]|uniref:Uncharacterized protein n=1 Tax=Dreissena polymorpha TaxID=45954 RepID=A0A9D3Y3B3_DREPO|nr:hypothetical protein DPMN_191612 [Dreissena polymorpha]
MYLAKLLAEQVREHLCEQPLAKLLAEQVREHLCEQPSEKTGFNAGTDCTG